MKKYYFTFGFGQLHEGCYTIIEAESFERAREIMFEKFGNKWAFQYDSEDKAGVKEWNLKLIN